MSDHVARTPGALYTEPRQAKRRRRCDGRLRGELHWIEVGDPVIWSALPPEDNHIGNADWWHHAYCADCAPIEAP